MTDTSVDLINLFARDPGDLVFFLAVIAISLAASFMAAGQQLRQPHDHISRRYLIAGVSIIGTWTLVILGALVVLLSDLESNEVLPPIERVAHVLTILILGWAFLTAAHEESTAIATIILGSLLAAALVGYIITAVDWFDRAEIMDFNEADAGLVWALVPAVLSILGAVFVSVYFRQVADAPLKIVFFAVLAVGYFITAGQVLNDDLTGDYAGVARLGFLAALPIFPAVVYRTVVGTLEAVLMTGVQSAGVQPGIAPSVELLTDLPQAEPPEEALFPRPDELPPTPQQESALLIRALGMILESPSPRGIPERIVTAAIEVLKVDVAAVLTLQGTNYVDIAAAYDAFMERSLSGLVLNLEEQPTLENAIERGAQRPLYADRNVNEMEDLYTRLDIDKTGPTYLQPLTHKKQSVGVLVVGMPYTGRELNEIERSTLIGFAVMAGGVLALSAALSETDTPVEERAAPPAPLSGHVEAPDEADEAAEREELQAELESSREQIAALTKQVTLLKLELDDERNRITEILGDTAEEMSVSQRLMAMTGEHEALRREREQLAARLQEAETMLSGLTGTDDDAVLAKLAEVLRRERDELQAKLDHIRGEGKVPPVAEDIIARTDEEKVRLEEDRTQLSAMLDDIESRLQELGVESGDSRVSQFITQLYEQRADLLSRIEALQRDRDTLLNDYNRLQEGIRQEEKREKQLRALEPQLRNLAGDREAITRQRDQLRGERTRLLAKIETLKEQRARLFAESLGYREELDEAHKEEGQLRQRIQQLSDERSALIAERDRLLAERQALETERDQAMARIQGDRERLQQLGDDGVGALTRMIETMAEQRNQLERELNETHTALADVENRLEVARVQARAQAQIKYRPDDPELLAGTVEELRTPMTSIIGYTRLLLSESAGILGKMQRDFLQRIDSNVARLSQMLDDLIHITELEAGEFALDLEPVDVVAIIEDALTNSVSQFSDRALTVHLNFDDSIPPVIADRDAVTQIVRQLLTNAYLASPPQSEITITARRDVIDTPLRGDANGSAKTVDALVVSFEDRGGGIDPEDEARVFGRKHKGSNLMIEGLGETGIGLAVAKALVEAHRGMLWLDSRKNVGSIFTFMLPLEAVLEPEA